MAKTLNAILRKQTWTGKEVARVLMMNLANDFRTDGKKQEPGPIFPEEKMEEMIKSLQDNDLRYFKVMEALYMSLIDQRNRCLAHGEMFYHGYYRLLYNLKELKKQEMPNPDEFKLCMEKMIDSIRYLNEFNALLDILAEVYDLEFLPVMKRHDAEEVMNKLKIFYTLQTFINSWATLTGRDERIPEVLMEQCTATEEDIEAAKATLRRCNDADAYYNFKVSGWDLFQVLARGGAR